MANSAWVNINQVARKEFNSFFASPAAWLFLGVFLLVTLFVFFWAEAFFARNIADLKPLFQWMPILLILLVSALTMRSWSEERRSGTLENLMTSPVRPWQLVLGKFFASLALVALALLLTFPLPITVSMMGSLDWGPVIGGYVASLFLAAAYIAIGLYMSARTDNPIVALILTVSVTGLFYLIGSNVLTGLFGYNISNLLGALGSGSRFESITRGVLDIRDLYYYLSIVAIFLTLNLFTLERLRWVGNKPQSNHWQWMVIVGLLIANFIVANIWLSSVTGARSDLTKGQLYSLSPATKQYIGQLQEPLLLRGYFSSKTHPLLEPLVPQLEDLLKEYQVAGGKHLKVEFIDPRTDQALETEAAEKYGIRPVPFRMASRYQTGVVNSYFDLVIAYGDQYEKLSFDDLIEVKMSGSGEPEVVLNNPEYAITRAIRKVTNAYQAGGNVFTNLDSPVNFKAYISPKARLPKALANLRGELETTLNGLKLDSDGKFNVEFADPDANGGQLGKQLEQQYGFGPQIASLFDPKPFWFYMMLEKAGSTTQIPLPDDLSQDGLKKTIEAAIQRMTPGILKNIALVTPSPAAPNQMNPYMPQPQGKQYQDLRSMLEKNVRLTSTDLMSGVVPSDVDLLLVLAPKDLNTKQVFAIDQFMMRGGTVILATSPFDVAISQTLAASKNTSGLEDWLKNNGIEIGSTMVLDPQNASLPVPVRRNLGMLSVNEIKMMPYPHFPDLRNEGLNQDNAMTSNLGQLTLNWASPVSIEASKNKERTVEKLLTSSAASWTSDDLNVLPDYQKYPKTGFAPKAQRSQQLLAVAIKGRFDSFFKGKDSPLLEAEKKPEEANKPNNPAQADDKGEDKTVVGSVIERSPESARLIVVASNTFADDSALRLASQGAGTQYVQPIAFIQNAIDWSLEDQGLLGIRSRAQFSRTLIPMEHETQLFWEYLNYALALLGLLGVWFWRKLQQRKTAAHYQQLLAGV